MDAPSELYPGQTQYDGVQHQSGDHGGRISRRESVRGTPSTKAVVNDAKVGLKLSLFAQVV